MRRREPVDELAGALHVLGCIAAGFAFLAIPSAMFVHWGLYLLLFFTVISAALVALSWGMRRRKFWAWQTLIVLNVGGIASPLIVWWMNRHEAVLEIAERNVPFLFVAAICAVLATRSFRADTRQMYLRSATENCCDEDRHQNSLREGE